VVPVLCAVSGNVQVAVNQALKDLHASVERLEAAANKLLERYQGMPELQAELQSYIDVCKEYTTGNLEWRLVRSHSHCEDLSNELSVFSRADMDLLGV